MHNALDEMTELDPPKSRALTLVERLRKHRHRLLNFLNVPGAEFHNNRAERQLRPVVIFRKLWPETPQTLSCCMSLYPNWLAICSHIWSRAA